MLWLAVIVFAMTSGSGSGMDYNDKQILQIAIPSVVGGIVVITITVLTVVCLAWYCYKRVSSLEYALSSKDKEESRRIKEESASLMTHEYDSVYTEDESSNGRPPNRRSRQQQSRNNISPQREIESEYSEIRKDFITQRLSHSRSATPAENVGIRSGVASYGSMSGDNAGNFYSYMHPDKHRESRNMSVQQRDDEHIPRTRVNTSILQSLKHSQSGTYVPAGKERTQPITLPHGTDQEPVYDRLGSHQEPERYDRLAAKEHDNLVFFETEKEYWSPAQTTSAIYSQLSDNRYREIPKQSIIVLEQLGSGQFGNVYKGLWMCDGEPLHVAVKSLKENASEEDRVKFLQEAALMGQFSHENIVGMYGVVTVTSPTLIVLELAITDLHRYLRGIRLSELYTSHLPRQLLQFTINVVSGMEYLSKKCFVHRDLAARNILLDFSLVCKIGDFGMARYLTNEQYYTSTENRPLPVKWMAPEALLYRIFSTASDVWSFGMLIYEIWSVGRKPFEQLTNQQVIDNLKNRQCHSPPPGCPRAIYTLMVGCWHPEPNERMTFQQLYKDLRQSEDYLLSWSSDIPSTARELGADHTHSQNLYSDLQTKYLTDSSMT